MLTSPSPSTAGNCWISSKAYPKSQRNDQRLKKFFVAISVEPTSDDRNSICRTSSARGLDQVLVETRLLGTTAVLLLAVSGQGDDEAVPRLPVRLAVALPLRSRPCPAGRCPGAQSPAGTLSPLPALTARHGRSGSRGLRSWPADVPSTLAAPTLSSTIKTRRGSSRHSLRLQRLAPSAAWSISREVGRRTRFPSPALRCAPRPSRRASPRDCEPT